MDEQYFVGMIIFALFIGIGMITSRPGQQVSVDSFKIKRK